jgi:hypothetical protein
LNSLHECYLRVSKYIENEEKPDLQVINKVLCLSPSIKLKNFDFFTTIAETGITVDLSIPHTEKVSVFSKIAGVENMESLKKSESGKFFSG